MTRLALAILALFVLVVDARSQENVSDFVFLMPPEWIIIPSSAVHNDNLQFRRFSVAIQNADYEGVKTGTSPRMQLIGPPGTFFNSIIFNCAHDPDRRDFLTFHLPDEVGPTSFKRDDWVSKVDVRVLADSRSASFPGEYIKGDLFIDASNDRATNGFDRMLTSQELIIEFGHTNDRLNLFIGNTIGKATFGEFMRAAVPETLSVPANSYLSTAAMLARCRSFKRTTR